MQIFKTRSIRFFIIIVSMLLLASCGESIRSQRAKWQNPKFFAKRRTPLYNTFVEEGGMAKKQKELQLSELQIRSRLDRELSSEPISLKEMPIINSTQNKNSDNYSYKEIVENEKKEITNSSQYKVNTLNSDNSINEQHANVVRNELKQEPLNNNKNNFIKLTEIPKE